MLETLSPLVLSLLEVGLSAQDSFPVRAEASHGLEQPQTGIVVAHMQSLVRLEGSKKLGMAGAVAGASSYNDNISPF